MTLENQEGYLVIVDLTTVPRRRSFRRLEDAVVAFGLVSTWHPYARVTLWHASGILRRRKPRNLFDLSRSPN